MAASDLLAAWLAANPQITQPDGEETLALEVFVAAMAAGGMTSFTALPPAFRYEALGACCNAPVRSRGVALWSFTVFADRVAAKQAALDAEFARRIEAGYPCAPSGVAETLQMRDGDKANWLTYKDACQDGIDAGLGDTVSGLPIRCTSNAMYGLTNNQGKALMQAARAWYAQAMGHHWQLGAAIGAAADDAALNAIDVTAGWP